MLVGRREEQEIIGKREIHVHLGCDDAFYIDKCGVERFEPAVPYVDSKRLPSGVC